MKLSWNIIACVGLTGGVLAIPRPPLEEQCDGMSSVQASAGTATRKPYANATSTALPSSTIKPNSTIATVTGVDLILPTGAFKAAIEGVSVDKNGSMWAAGYLGQTPNNDQYAMFYQASRGAAVLSELAPEQLLRYPSNDSVLAGGRWLKDGTLLQTAAAKREVLRVDPENGSFYSYCKNAAMLQPNDLALSTHFEGVFLSGMNYTENTTAGVSGDLWTCKAGNETKQFPPKLLKDADIHRTNGIETSPDGKSLYLSSAQNVAGAVVANTIFKFEIDGKGMLVEKAPTLFYNFTETPETDIDGMRTDVEGNLYVTRNGLGQIVKFSPEGKVLLVIELPGMGGPSNLEFGGVNGTTLFAVGKCKSNATIGCAAYYETKTSVGKAFAELTKM